MPKVMRQSTDFFTLNGELPSDKVFVKNTVKDLITYIGLALNHIDLFPLPQLPAEMKLNFTIDRDKTPSREIYSWHIVAVLEWDDD